MKNPITDPTARAYWREYQSMCKQGNPLGLSFVEYVAQRVHASTSIYTLSTDVPWFVTTCGHQHPWGVSCVSVTT
jgi:lysozyme family protein